MNLRQKPNRATRNALLPLLLAAALAPASTLLGQAVATPSPTNATADGKVTPTTTTQGGEAIIELSPFVVNSEENTGYEATNTMSGTRINSKLEDIAATISVMTKQQMLDFAAFDINDIYAMEAGADGSRTFTEPGVDFRGNPVDSVSMSPTTANRIRGLGTANMSINGFASSNSIPVDTYNIDAVEISKGPNSSIFGVGEVAGTVNLVRSAAQLNRQSTGATVSVSSYGTKRATFDINRNFFRHMLALRYSSVVEDKGFIRTPSFDKTRRHQTSLTFRPFKYTTLRVSNERFREDYSRANSVMPRDLVTLWKQAGKPNWNPSNNTWSYTDIAGRPVYNSTNGQWTTSPGTGAVVTGTQVSSGSAQTFFPADVWLTGQGTGAVRSSMFIDFGQAQWLGPTRWTSTNTAFPWRELVVFNVPTTKRPSGVPATYPEYFGVPAGYIPSSNTNVAGTIGYQPIKSTTDRSVYDYENINLAALNRAYKSAGVTTVELEQFLVSTSTHQLAAQLSYFRERVSDVSRAYFGNGGADGIGMEILPDVNVTMPDGSINPHYGSPYVRATEPQIYSRPITNDLYRINLAYQLDLSRAKNRFLRLLGKQKLVGYHEQFTKELAPGSLRFGTQITSTFPTTVMQNNAAWLALPTTGSGAGNVTRSPQFGWNARYYLGTNANGVVEYAPTTPDLSNGVTYTRWGNDVGSTSAASNQWTQQTLPVGETWFAGSMQQSKVRTAGFVWQSSLLKDRLVTTYGRRQDSLRSRNGPSTWATGDASARDANGLYRYNVDWLSNFEVSPWLVTNKSTGATVNKGKTDTFGIVAKPFEWLHLRYNQSNSFKPDAYVLDYTASPLPNPHGKTEDYGFRLILLDKKLSIGLTKYETSSIGSRISSVAGRAFNIDFDPVAGANGSNLDLQSWLMAELLKKDPTMTVAAQEAEANRLAGLTSDFVTRIRANSTSITQNVMSKGYEFDLYYNPNRYLSIRLGGAKTESVISGLGEGFTGYLEDRKKVWTSVVSPFDNTTKFWDATQGSTSGFSTARDYYENLVNLPMQLALAANGFPQPQVRKYKANIVTSYRLEGLTRKAGWRDITVGTNVRWEDKGALGFYGLPGVADPLNPTTGVDAGKVFVRGYDRSRPIWDKSRTYIDAFVAMNLNLFPKVRSQVQLNIRNLTENGSLRGFTANPDGSLTNFRIIDPREIMLTVRFDL